VFFCKKNEIFTVKIKGLVVTSRYGALSSGDLLRTDAAFAKHLVEDCAAAEYVTATVSDQPKRRRPAKPTHTEQT
jgi:hypothetical protein